MSASWPLASLLVSAGSLELSISFLASYRFRPEQVISIHRAGLRGVQIEHTRGDVAARVVFTSFTSPKRLLAEIAEIGFEPAAPPGSEPSKRRFPFRIPFVVGAVVLWNALFLVDRPWDLKEDEFIWGPGTLTAIALLFVGSQLIHRWKPLQRIALAGPEAIARIEPGRKLTALISGVMLAVGLLGYLLS